MVESTSVSDSTCTCMCTYVNVIHTYMHIFAQLSLFNLLCDFHPPRTQVIRRVVWSSPSQKGPTGLDREICLGHSVHVTYKD